MARAEGLREYSFSIRVATMTDGVNMLPRNRAAAAAWSLQTVYDLIAKI